MEKFTKIKSSQYTWMLWLKKIQSAKDLIKEKITEINLDWNKQSDLKLNLICFENI